MSLHFRGTLRKGRWLVNSSASRRNAVQELPTSVLQARSLSVPFFAFPRQPNRKQARLSPTGQEDTRVRDDCPQLVTLTASTPAG